MAKEHVMCQCGHGRLTHFKRCAVRGCTCIEFIEDPKNVFVQDDEHDEEVNDDEGEDELRRVVEAAGYVCAWD